MVGQHGWINVTLGLELENDDGVILPVKDAHVYIHSTKWKMHTRMSQFQCDGSHHHTPRGQGPPARLAGNYPGYMAKVIAGGSD